MELTLFVAGSAPSSLRARSELARWLERDRGREVALRVVDVLQDPAAAAAERVLATPSLVRHRPLPRRKVVGDLSDWELLMRAFAIEEPR
jgi:circadian clock protein KaiB